MSEELLQRDLLKNPDKCGNWDYYNIGATSVKALKEYGIISNINYGKLEKKKVDALIIQNKKVIAVIEFKKPSQFKTKAQKDKAIQQEIEVAKILGSKLIIATDTKSTIWVNALTGKKILNESKKQIQLNFDHKDEEIVKLIEKINYSINDKNNQIKPRKLVNPTDLAKSIWQDVWSVSGATPENCLYTFVELFIFKYLSDLGILGQGINFDHLLERYQYNIDNSESEALEYYANTIRPQIKKLFPEGSDGTTIINGTIFVSKDQKAVKGYSTVFKKVIDKFNNYGKLENIDLDFKSQLFESFLKESISKKNWGQFFTPLKVVRAIVEIAKDDIKDGAKICDPACGVGKFLLEPIVSRLSEFYKVKKGVITPKITIHGYDKGFDKDEQKTIILAKANMLIYFSDLIRENPNLTNEFSNLFNDSFHLKTNSILGTLSDATQEEYDLILTNPPYVMSGSSNLKEEVKKDGTLVDYYKINAMGVEGLFMEWIVKNLKPNGKAYIVVPDGIFNRQHDKNLREYLKEECLIDLIISLPIKTFFTTPKKTYILGITKKKSKKVVQKDPVFTYLVSEIGESRDVYRFDIESDDLSESVKLYNSFKGSKQYFVENNNDKRCKIQPIESFDPNKHWLVDKWWSKEEKVELGILESENSIKYSEFPALLDEIANSIISFKDEILDLSQKKKIKSKFVSKSIEDLFTFPATNSKITKTFCQKNPGEIPVYASSKDENSVLGWIKHDIKNIKYYKNCLSWNRNGSVGYVFVRDHIFTTNEDHRALVIKEEYENKLSKEYLKHIIEKQLFLEGFSFLDKCGLDKIKSVKIDIPINDKEFDLLKQEDIVDKIEQREKITNKIKEYKDFLTNLIIDVKSSESNFKTITVKKLFTSKQGNAFYTKKRILGNSWGGNIPVYSSNTKENGVLMHIALERIKKNDIYYQRCLTWSVDGVGAGKIFARNEANLENENLEKFTFTFNNHCGILIPNEDNLNLNYLKAILQPLFYSKVKGYNNKKLGTNQIEDIEISIPINNSGNYDLIEQTRIAKIYEKIDYIKLEISKELEKLIHASITYE